MIKKFLLITFLIFYTTIASTQVKQNFHGVGGDILADIIVRTKSGPDEVQNSLTPQQAQLYLEQTTIEIKNSLAAYGYFKPDVKTTLNHAKNNWVINFYIKPGELLRITKLDLQVSGEGLSDEAFQLYLQNFPLKQGDVVRSKVYHEAKSGLVDLAAQRGYFAAKIEQSTIFIDLQKYEATISIRFDTGPRYYFGEIHFLPSPYSRRFLQRFVPFKKEAPYSNKKIVKLQENLGNSNFFQQVIVTPRPEQAENLNVPIEVEVIPRKKVQYSLGLGFGTDTGPRGIAELQVRRLNPSGHHFEALIQPSQKMNHCEASYVIPGYNPVTDLYKLSAAAEEQHLDTSGKSRNEKIEASYIRTFFGWQQTLSLGLRDEHSVPTDGRPIINSTMLLPNLNWSRIKSDDPLNPNRGYQINFNLRGATKSLISNTDFIQGLVQAKALVPLSSVTRLVARGQLGYTFISDIDQLPISLQFYTGGSQTVRGYQFQEIGPGRTLLVGSVELQQKIKGNLYAALFMDAGNVSNGLTNNLMKSVGVGVLWRSPIGAIEITLAQALDKPGQPRLLQFSMGPEL
ncbi:MAG: outer membrane protein assembly factor [Gammaproteobacteria bacterium]|nr:outer membrane protein assembly factor [Gammaproteobacteria bacterium]